jgi:alkylation response protein AidB-like acyl-CoA dehydrogenase
MAIDYAVPEEVRELAMRTRAFVDEQCVPAEGVLLDSRHGIPDAERARLQGLAKAAGVFAPTGPTEYGGHALSHTAQAVILEESGRSLLGPIAMNCGAPDEGNILLLDKVATPEQKDRYLGPLVRGEMRSAFAMTEPAPGAGADPESLNTSAVKDGNSWVLNGRKWFITGGVGSGFAIVMARTSGGATMFLVDGSNPGMKVECALETMDIAFSGGHAVIDFEDCQVDESMVLGTVDEGFRYAQIRLAPARLTHCMRWLGAARRTHEHAVAYAGNRQMFGTNLASLGMAQQLIADNEIDIAASRALIWQAAWVLDQHKPGKQETSITKTFVAEAVYRIADRSMQLCGGSGTLLDRPVARIFQEIRPFRIYDGPSEVHRWAIARRASRNAEKGLLPGDWM